MIAKITRGAKAGGLAAYLHGPGRANEHVYDGRLGGAVIGGTLGADGARDGRAWAADMQAAIDGRPEIKGPVWHMSLRAAPDDPTLSDAGWRHAAQIMGERMGWAEQPWVMVRHGADHVHIVVSRVGWDRSIWHARNDRKAAQLARVEVEKDLGLTRAPVMRDRGRSLTSGEHARALRTGNEPPRHQLAQRVTAAAQASRGLGREAFEASLNSLGVLARANVASTGRVSGYSFGIAGHVDSTFQQVWFKGSRLDRSLSWKTLGPMLSAPLPEPAVQVAPKKMLERSSTYQQRVETARAEAVAADVQRRRTASPKAATEAYQKVYVGRTLAWRTIKANSERTQIVAKRDALGRRLKVGDTPIGHIPTEALEARRLADISNPRRPGQGPLPRLAGRPTNLGERAYVDRAQDQGRRPGGGRYL